MTTFNLNGVNLQQSGQALYATDEVDEEDTDTGTVTSEYLVPIGIVGLGVGLFAVVIALD